MRLAGAVESGVMPRFDVVMAGVQMAFVDDPSRSGANVSVSLASITTCKDIISPVDAMAGSRESGVPVKFNPRFSG
jgi:hypothetical protein